MSGETIAKDFAAQYYLDYYANNLVVENMKGQTRVYYFDRAMRLLDQNSIFQHLNVNTLDDTTWRLLENYTDIEQIAGQPVFGTGPDGIAAHAAQYCQERDLPPRVGTWFADFVEQCFVGFGFNQYHEEGILCDTSDFGWTPENVRLYIDPLTQAKALRHSQRGPNRNLHTVQLNDAALNYNRDLAPFFFRALVF
ncbi:hypothetical protein SAMN05421823_109181 [Catalinimonas alkaloidigena]|uniref:Uncharacterized protein n=1 Tax=Catalinimonas alkaloidigena TaxID=1075417 RepID=A0A1G9PFQ1_9BACT|nr:hypothetical protein [Catalinimonas alkaloidigena]SDL97610.1 hypothetical protein SAMN05421823_109181 [Catalinimonas alkaloidigena]